MFKKITLAALLSSATMLSSPAMALEEGTLLVWINGDKGYNGLQEIADRFTEELGVPVVVEHPEDLPTKFQQAAANGEGPDIVIWAHDRFGEWVAGGLLSSVEPSDANRANTFDFSWDAVTFDGATWGYPVSVEAVGLIYNKDLIATPPATFEEIADLDIPGVTANIMWDYNNTYFSMPLLMAGGGYAFQKVDGAYDASDTGVNNAGAIAGVTVIKNLIDGGTMPAGVDYGVMDAALNQGETAMVINGPWAWSNLEASGINFGVAPIPSVEGNPSKAFVGVLAAALNAASPNKDLAVEFIENYMLSDAGLQLINDDSALGAVASISFAATLAGDENIAATLANAQSGIPMPSNPEMGKFWGAMGPALTSVTSGQASVEDALNDAAARILAD